MRENRVRPDLGLSIIMSAGKPYCPVEDVSGYLKSWYNV